MNGDRAQPRELLVFDVPMRVRFRGQERRSGVLMRGPVGWGEFSPFPDYDAATCRPWLAAAREAADDGWPAEPDQSGSGITAPFNAPSQGPPPWDVYRIEPRSATVVLGVEPGGLTRFRF